MGGVGLINYFIFPVSNIINPTIIERCYIKQEHTPEIYNYIKQVCNSFLTTIYYPVVLFVEDECINEDDPNDAYFVYNNGSLQFDYNIYIPERCYINYSGINVYFRTQNTIEDTNFYEMFAINYSNTTGEMYVRPKY